MATRENCGDVLFVLPHAALCAATSRLIGICIFQNTVIMSEPCLDLIVSLYFPKYLFPNMVCLKYNDISLVIDRVSAFISLNWF